MSKSNPPEVTFELDGGSLTIRTAEAIYRILVTGQGTAPRQLAAAKPAVAELPPAKPEPIDDWDEPAASDRPGPAPSYKPQGDEDNEYYKELTQDMYAEVGSLAKRLSMSISDVKSVDLDAIDLEGAGDRLESAKDQLESVVEMTEQATMTIIEEGESIQGAIDNVRKIMEGVGGNGDAKDDSASTQSQQDLSQALEAVSAYLGSVGGTPLSGAIEEVQAIIGEVGQAATAAPAPKPAAKPKPEPAAPSYSFPLDLVFQTTYELCTNETVKKHLKAMWDAGEKAFSLAKVEAGLNKLSSGEPDEDNFLNVDLKGVLKVLFAATKVDKFKSILKKMAGTSDQIFLDQFLPMEAVPKEAEAAPAPEPEPEPEPASGGGDSELTERLENLAATLQNVSDSLAPPELPEDMLGLLNEAMAGASTGGNGLDKNRLEELDETLNRVFNSVNTIIQSLSFQDLSGQAIYRIVRLLTDFQVQLLAMLVGFGSKIKNKETREELSSDESEKLAQEEVDRALGTLGIGDLETEGDDGEDDRGPLDQDAVNSMLESLGF